MSRTKDKSSGKIDPIGQTLPGFKVERPTDNGDTERDPDKDPSAESQDDTSAPLSQRTQTFPPTSWDKENAVISSATPNPELGVTGGDSLIGSSRTRIPEARAREILNARFTAAGAELQADFQFTDKDLIVTLDGYDPKRCIGYSFISHSDADVVTDFDEGAGVAFEQLARESRAHVLIVHDTDVPSTDALERRIDAYFELLNARHQETGRF